MTAAPTTPELANDAQRGSHCGCSALCGVIYCDPPWRYDFAETDNRAIENKYSTMSIDELCDH